MGAAGNVPPAAKAFMDKVTDAIINPLIGLIFAAAVVYFLWGLMMFILNGSNDTKRSEGRQHMLWGIIGMTVMIAVYTIIQVAVNTLGLNQGFS